LLREEVNQHPDATLNELQTVLAEKGKVRASLPTICRALQHLDLARKKKVSSPMGATKKNAAGSER
jgi:transposase